MDEPFAEELDLALKAVHRASIMTKKVMRGITSFDKSDASPVTIADFAAQALIICAISTRYPDDSFIAEESADMLPNDPTALDRVWQLVISAAEVQPDLPLPANKEDMMRCIDLGSGVDGPREGRIWILDPIDGTAAFMKSQQYAVCLCLTVNGEQCVGVLGCPNLKPDLKRVDEEYVDQDGYGVIVSAVAGRGSFVSSMDDEEIGSRRQVNKCQGRKDREQLQFIESLKSRNADVATQTEVYQSLGVTRPPVDVWSMQMKYVALSVGGCDGMIRVPPSPSYRSAVWDHAGGQLIYAESGGVLTDVYGKRFVFGKDRHFHDTFGYVAADKDFHPMLLSKVQESLRHRGAR